MTTGLIEQVAAADAARKAEADRRYRELVRKAAGGADRLDPNKVLGDLAAAGRTPDDFRADVAAAARRYELLAQLAEADRMEAERAEVSAKLKALNEEFAEVKARHDARANPLRLKIKFLDQRRIDVVMVRRELRDTAVDPETARRITAARQASAAAWARVAAAKDAVRRQREYVDTLELRAQNTWSAEAAKAYLEDRVKPAAELERLRAELAAAEEACRRTVAEQDRVEELALRP